MMHSSFAAVATVALVASRAAALIPSGGYKEVSAGLPTNKGPTDDSFANHEESTSGAVITCSSKGWSESASASASSYISAVASAIADVCDPYFTGKEWDFDKIYGWAFAYAEAAAEAQAVCFAISDGGTASGCAYADAYAEAAAHAYALAAAEATAEAIAKNCYYPCANASAWAFGSAEQLTFLFAKAYADVDVIACAKDNEFSAAVAYVDCYAHIIAKTVAVAIAEAAAEANCYYKEADADASAAILAAVFTTVKEWEVCEIRTDAVGTADADADGNAFTFDKDITYLLHE